MQYFFEFPCTIIVAQMKEGLAMNLKEDAAKKAATFVEDGMIVGLGTGSTAYYLVEELGRRVKEEGLNIVGVTTSIRTAEQAKALGIPLKSIDEVAVVDLTIDGADEIDAHFQGIKGGGGALLYEKTVATYSKDYIWIVDESKMKETLGAFPLPIEVIPYGSEQLFRIFEEKGMAPQLRLNEDGTPYRTDAGHYIIDCHMELIEHPHKLADWLDHLTGVVEHGLFINMVHTVIVGTQKGTIIQQAK